MKNIIGVCESLYAELRKNEDSHVCQVRSIQLSGADHAWSAEEFGDSGEAASVNVAGYVAEVLRKGGAALAKMPKEMLKVACY